MEGGWHGEIVVNASDFRCANDRVRIKDVEILSDDWAPLRKYRLDFRRNDGRVQGMTREVYERGNSAVALLLNPLRDSVLLTRQFRLPALVGGHSDGMLLEAPAGMLDGHRPDEAIRREIEEETGYRISQAKRLFAAYMSPGAVTERIHFFVAEFDDAQRTGAGGGHAEEGEDIEVMELKFEDALAMIDSGEIVDAKTIMLLLYAACKRRR